MAILLIDNSTDQSFFYPLSIDKVDITELTEAQITMDVLRLDRIHPVVSGNKWYKLKGWLAVAARNAGETASQTPSPHIVTFGGAWSNHIVATACAAQAAGFKATGIIRGERPADPANLSDTLQAAEKYGMHLEFISREDYRKKDDTLFIQQLTQRYPYATIIPEGGAGQPGIDGSRDILNGIPADHYTHILCAVGTGTTFQGLSQIFPSTTLGIPVLKGVAFQNPNFIDGYHFGGYAKLTEPLLDFMNDFYRRTGIPSDFVYTGKLFYAALDLIRQHFFPPDSRLLVVHSGGLQGNTSLPAGRLIF